MHHHETYMARALEIARKGAPWAMPNPMVGAVIVDPDGRIIGEGYHRKCGEGHAEVNAIASVGDESLLRHATMYVTLEPCAHYGRTGPCAKLIIDKGIPNVVVGCRDPFDKVDGKGIEMMREAGINVTVGVLENQCKSLNAIFFTAHTQHRPFIILKWAQTADGYMDIERDNHTEPLRISNSITSMLTHRLRAVCDGILVGSNTVIADNPGLDTRLWPGKSPRPIVLDRRKRIKGDYKILSRNPILLSEDISLNVAMTRLYESGITSILVEGGAQVLQSFLDLDLWDLIQVETSQIKVGEKGRTPAPHVVGHAVVKEMQLEGNNVKYYSENPLIDVKNL